MKFPEIRPSTNGKYEAPASTSGALLMSGQRTQFPQDEIRFSWRPFLYFTSRQWFGSAPLLRWLLGLPFFCALLWAPGWLPGRWWVSIGSLALWAAIFAPFYYWRQRDFVYFTPQPAPAVKPAPLDASKKLPVHVTGHFSVENKEQHFTWLPGFYRTFATREHALLCQVAERRFWGIAYWPEDQIGLWYIFFTPEKIVRIGWGHLYFDNKARTAIAVTHRVTIPKRGRFRQEQIVDETVYLAFQNQVDGQTILADLYHDAPHQAFAHTSASPTTAG